MFDDTDSHKKARANLILISMAVLLFIFGEGEFGKAGILGGSIEFGNEYALPTAGILMFYFFVWRYLLSSKGVLKEFRWDIWTLFYTNKVYEKIRDKWLEGKAIQPSTISNFKNNSIFSNEVGASGFWPPRVYGDFFPVGLVFVPESHSTCNKQNDYPFDQSSDAAKIDDVSRIDSWKLLTLEIFCILKAIFFRSGFTDVIFPFALGYVSTVILTYKISNLYFVGTG